MFWVPHMSWSGVKCHVMHQTVRQYFGMKWDQGYNPKQHVRMIEHHKQSGTAIVMASRRQQWHHLHFMAWADLYLQCKFG